MTPLAVTMGDPAGIGGELTLKSWLALRQSNCVFVALDDPARLAQLARDMGLDVAVQVVDTPAAAGAIFPDALPVLPVPLSAPSVPGSPDPGNSQAVVGSIELATKLALRGAVGAVVTNPINKAVLYRSGFAYPGHTEFLAALTEVAGQEIMMLASPMLRVVPVTVHMSLRDAITTLTPAAIVAAARTTATALRRDFGVVEPRLAIAGLNPHAGEQGGLGTEEVSIVQPAIDALRAEGINASGPWPPDTMFTAGARQKYDVAICMYHDQALIPLKTLDMDHGVNVTLGLPIIRTSPDHGTAFDIAGKGLADPTSLVAAIELAATLAQRRTARPA